ncbi:MAG: YbaK/EbsC family protein [Acidimicrobiales bacterium]
MHANTCAVAEALARLAPEAEVRELAESTRTAADAAAALGCPLGAIANSLVFVAGGEPVLIMTSGAHRVDVDFAASAAGLPRLRRATADEVKEATGQPIGGVAPVGHRSTLRAFVDQDLARHEVVWAAAGTPRSVFATTYDQLLAMTGGSALQVTR